MEQAIETLNITKLVNQSGSRTFQEFSFYRTYVYSSLLLTTVSKLVKSHPVSVKIKAGLKEICTNNMPLHSVPVTELSF